VSSVVPAKESWLPVARARTALVPLVACLLLQACGGDDDPGSSAVVATGNPDTCTGEVVDVVVSVGQWGDVVREVGGDCANVTTIVAEPRGSEPRKTDLAAFSDADLVVVNGAGYDSWAEDAAAAQHPAPPALSVAGLVDAEDGDPHLWYEPQVVHAVAPALADELAELSPDAVDVFEANAATWQAGLRPYLDAVQALGATVSGRTYAATGTTFDRMAASLGLDDVTPEGYRRGGNEPAPDDLAAFEAALTDGSVDVLVHDTADGGVPEQLADTAEAAGVPVLEVTESPGDEPFLAWQLAQLSALSDVLAESS
jgi:zinc/manganese transport system substrate-binding protein